jgi:hypothetical protein
MIKFNFLTLEYQMWSLSTNIKPDLYGVDTYDSSDTQDEPYCILIEDKLDVCVKLESSYNDTCVNTCIKAETCIDSTIPQHIIKIKRSVVDDAIADLKVDKSDTLYDRIKRKRKLNGDVGGLPMRKKYRKLLRSPVKRELTDAKLKCLSKDQLRLRNLCAVLYDMFDKQHVIEGLCPDKLIRNIARECFTYDTFEIVLFHASGVIVVNRLAEKQYIEIKCKCGVFRRDFSEFIAVTFLDKWKL